MSKHKSVGATRRILYVLPYFDSSFGGPVSTTKSLAEAMVKQGYFVTVLATNVASIGFHPISFPTKKLSYRLVLLPTLFPTIATNLKLFFSPATIIWFWKHHRYFDLVHLQDIFIPTYIFISIICYFKKIPYILSPHGSLEFSEQRGRVWIKKVLFFLGIRWVVEHAQAIVAIARKEKNLIETSVFTKKILWIPNIVPRPIAAVNVSRKKLGLPSSKPYLLFLGRMYELKGIIELLDGFAHYLTLYPQSKLQLAYAGPDAGGLTKLKIRIDQQALNSRVHIVGMVKGSKKTWLIKRAKAIVLLSKSEGFPTVLAEAASLQIPAICSNECLVPGLVKRKGAILTDRSVRKIARAIKQIDLPNTLLHHRKKAALAWYKTTCNEKAVTAKYEKLYYQLG